MHYTPLFQLQKLYNSNKIDRCSWMTSVKPTRMQKTVVACCMQLIGHSPGETDETHEVFRAITR
jgi:hypothetical protein